MRVVEQISSALDFAHRHGIAHGNLGTSNVLLDAEGNAYLADFRIGIGPAPEPGDDVRALAGLASDLLPIGTPGRLKELVDRAGRRAGRARRGGVRRGRPFLLGTRGADGYPDRGTCATPTRASEPSPPPSRATSSAGASSPNVSWPG